MPSPEVRIGARAPRSRPGRGPEHGCKLGSFGVWVCIRVCRQERTRARRLQNLTVTGRRGRSHRCRACPENVMVGEVRPVFSPRSLSPCASELGECHLSGPGSKLVYPCRSNSSITPHFIRLSLRAFVLSLGLAGLHRRDGAAERLADGLVLCSRGPSDGGAVVETAVTVRNRQQVKRAFDCP